MSIVGHEWITCVSAIVCHASCLHAQGFLMCLVFHAHHKHVLKAYIYTHIHIYIYIYIYMHLEIYMTGATMHSFVLVWIFIKHVPLCRCALADAAYTCVKAYSV